MAVGDAYVEDVAHSCFDLVDEVLGIGVVVAGAGDDREVSWICVHFVLVCVGAVSGAAGVTCHIEPCGARFRCQTLKNTYI